MVKAVDAGMTRYAVAKIVGVSQARVSQIPGMPPGKNLRKTAGD
jgi:predicted transcriptional regulator